MKSRIMALLGFLLGCLVAAIPVFAADAIVLPTSVDLGPIMTYGGVIVSALVGMIVIRKAIKTTNRS